MNPQINVMYIPKIDSCKLSMPLRNCEIINQELLDQFTDLRINKNTGESTPIKTYVGLPFHETLDNGTSIKIWIEKQITYDKQTNKPFTEDYLTILANSKHLQADYFKGITKDTLKLLYDYMMSLNVFSCTYQTFKNARYSDIDICFDFKCDETNFSTLKRNILKTAINPLYFHTANKFNNSGIWTPTKKEPRKQATPSKPFIKLYSKEIDFTYNSYKFANKYFKPQDYQDLIRFECTVSNYQHKRKLGLDKKPTISDLLNSDLQPIIKDIAMEYFEKPKYTKNTGLKPMDKVLIDSINLLIENGTSKHKIHDLFNRYDVSPKQRRRLLEKYQELYSQDLINKKKLEADNISHSLFEFLGLKEPLEFDENDEK